MTAISQDEYERRQGLMLSELEPIALAEHTSHQCTVGHHTRCKGIRMNRDYRFVKCECKCHVTSEQEGTE